MAHDFTAFPELSNADMDFYYMESPHKQITEDIWVKCVKVHDGDTISVEWSERSFIFPVRMDEIQAPELNEGVEGKASQKYLEKILLGKNVYLHLSKQRVEKWGRLLAEVYVDGIKASDELILMGYAMSWKDFTETKLSEIKLPKELMN